MMDYHSPHSPHLTRTALTCFMRSRTEYHDVYVAHNRQPRPSTKPQQRGIVLHAILVEGKDHRNLLQKFPGDYLTKDDKLKGDWRGFVADNPDKLCVKPAEYEDLIHMVNQVMRNPLIADDVSDNSAVREQTYYKEVNGVECKCKIDLWRDGQPPLDYKCTEKLEPEWFRKHSASFGYWLQDAFYSPIVMVDRLTFRCIEVNPPYRVHDYWFDAVSRQRAFDKHEWLLDELKVCRESGDWSEKWPNEVSVPPWAFGDFQDDELVTVGDL